MTQNSEKQRGRSPGRPWRKGQSGNPGGRPKTSKAFVEWCQGIMEREGQEALYALARDAEDERIRLSAWQLIAAYAFGKPTQTVDLNTESQGPAAITVVIQSSADERTTAGNTSSKAPGEIVNPRAK